MNSPVEIKAETMLFVAADPFNSYSSRKIFFSSADGNLDKILIKALSIFCSSDLAAFIV